MMNQSTDDLLKIVDSRYTLVSMVSKRARQIVAGRDPLIETESVKPVTIAVEEIGAGEVTYSRSAECEAVEQARES